MRSRRRTRRPARNSRRSDRPTLRQVFHDANSRAKQRANRRMGKRTTGNRRMGKRGGMTSMRAAIDSATDDGFEHLSLPQRMFRWLCALALLPFCVVTTVALFTAGDAAGVRSSYWMDLLSTRQFLYFSVGAFLMAGWFFTGLLERLFLYFYVLGHELTHAIFIYACGGKVGGISISADGGYVMTNKSNVLIALSPYFIPFWSVITLGISTLLGFFFQIPYHNEILYFLIGFTWSFHMLWTLWMIPRDQPDLKENDFFFSIVVIYLTNIVLLSILLCLAPGNLTWHHWANEFMDAWIYLKNHTHKVGIPLR